MGEGGFVGEGVVSDAKIADWKGPNVTSVCRKGELIQKTLNCSACSLMTAAAFSL